MAVDRSPSCWSCDHPIEAEWPPVAGGDQIDRTVCALGLSSTAHPAESKEEGLAGCRILLQAAAAAGKCFLLFTFTAGFMMVCEPVVFHIEVLVCKN